MAIERVRVKLPERFDERKPSHTEAVLAKLAEKHGPGWEVEAVDTEAGSLIATRQAANTQVAAQGDQMVLGLARGTKPSDGDRIAAKFEDANPGYTLTLFDPFVGRAVMTRLTEDEVRCRGAVATALGVKPWEVQIKRAADGAFNVQLPRTYTPSKHYDKLVEVAEAVVGAPGWYVRADAAKLTARIIPGERPMFAPAYAYPFRSKPDVFRIGIGQTLPAPGEQSRTLAVNLDGTVGLLVQGLAGSGKSVSINGFIYGALAAGHELAVIDVPHKKADFEWMKPYVRDHGWGCDSLEQALTVVTLVYEEGQRRGKLFDEHGAKKWQDLPASVRAQNPIITLVVDELSGLLTKDPIPKSLPKDHPMRVEAEMRAAAQDMLAVTLTKIPAEMRAAGIRLLYASQQAQSNTGIPPAIKLNIPNRVLLGANPSKQQRGHAFANPEKAPEVPEYIAEDEKASRGVGVAEFEGQAPVVFKSYFAPDSDFDASLRDLGVRRTTRPEPTAAQVERVVPRLDDDDFADGDRPRSRLESEGGWGERDGRDAPGPVLKGAAAAAHALKVQSGR